MARESRLFKRAGKWTFRVRVPADVQGKIGKKEIWKALGDVPHAEARRLARVESVKADALFAEARAPASNLALNQISDADLQHLALTYLHRLEAGAEPMPLDASLRGDLASEASEKIMLVGQSPEDASLQLVATALAEEARVELGRDATIIPRLAEYVQRALIEHYSREIDRADLVQERSYDPLFANVDRMSPPPASRLTLARAVELYKAEPDRAGVSPKTRAAYEFRFAMLLELLGPQKLVDEISRADVREVRDFLMKLPPNATKRFPRTGLRQVAEIAEKNGLEPMSPKSVGLYVEALSALFRWLTKEELAQRNPAVGLKSPALPAETDRRPFTVDELNRLFAAPAFSSGKGKGWMYWLPRIALFTGARFAELLGLKAADVIEIDDVHMLRIEPNDVRGVKTRTSRRVVPIHPALITLGLLDHARRVPADGILFPDARGPQDMVTARNKKMGAALRKVIADPDVVFHSFRHTFKDAAQRADLPRDVIAALGGWDVPGGRVAMDGYGRAKFAVKLAAEVEKIDFEGVCL